MMTKECWHEAMLHRKAMEPTFGSRIGMCPAYWLIKNFFKCLFG